MDIKEFDLLCLEFQKLKDEKSDLQDKVSALEEEICKRENMILAELQSNDLERFSFSNGLVSKTHSITFKKTDPEVFKNFMKSKNMWDDVADINYQTLRAIINGWVKEEEAKGNFNFTVPGLEISDIEKISLRRK